MFPDKAGFTGHEKLGQRVGTLTEYKEGISKTPFVTLGPGRDKSEVEETQNEENFVELQAIKPPSLHSHSWLEI